MRKTERIDLTRVRFDRAPRGYQREVNEAFKNRLVKNWDPDAAASPLIGRRKNGDLVCIDGQHEILAYLEQGHRFGWCRVVDVTSKGREAALFTKCNRERRGVSAYYRFIAALRAGDKTARAVSEAAKFFGLRLCSGKGDWPAIKCIEALMTLERLEAGLVFKTLDVISRAWLGDNVGLERCCVLGVGRFIHEQGDRLDSDRLYRTLQNTPGLFVKNQLSQSATGAGVAFRAAAVIAKAYRKRK